MSFTKVTAAGIGTTGTITYTNVSVAGVITATSATFSGNVSVGGTLTYEDVTNVDSVGLITARNGIIVPDGGVNVTGVVTATSFSGDGSALTGIDATQIVTGNTSVQTVDTGSDGHIKFNTEGTEAMRVDSSQRLGIGTTSPSDKLHVSGNLQNIRLEVASNTSKHSVDFYETTTQRAFVRLDHSLGELQIGVVPAWFTTFYTNNTERARIDSSGRFLVGTSTARSNIYYATNATTPPIQAEVATNSYSAGMSLINYSASGYNPWLTLGASSSNTLGTNTALGGSYQLGGINFVGADGTNFRTGASIVAVNDQGPAWSSGDCPARLVFSTTADGASSPTERMRINKNGYVGIGGAGDTKLHIEGTVDTVDSTLRITATGACSMGLACNGTGAVLGTDTGGILFKTGITVATPTTTGTERMRIGSTGEIRFNNSSASPAQTNDVGITIQPDSGGTNGTISLNRSGYAAILCGRKTNDGNLVDFYQDGLLEGSISVSGSTVSYNGGHIARWSQLPGGAVREEILRGTVLSNIDEMCAWDDEGNEQLNRMKVSDVEGDPNVAGVFQAWDDDDDTYTDDFYCAMTGDFIIRIAQGVTVQRGDLLMSAGDGTAKPQDDDIIRSKTVAKVTSTHVSCTYDDGSYCVPCVLMAC